MYTLSTLQRSLVALSALHLRLAPRAQVLAQNQVTEDDLQRHHADWERLLVLRVARPHDTPPELMKPGQCN